MSSSMVHPETRYHVNLSWLKHAKSSKMFLAVVSIINADPHVKIEISLNISKKRAYYDFKK